MLSALIELLPDSISFHSRFRLISRFCYSHSLLPNGKYYIINKYFTQFGSNILIPHNLCSKMYNSKDYTYEAINQ